MDNHFVPNLTLGLPMVESLLKLAALPVDCHLVIADPDRWAPAYAEAGAGSVTIHVEAASAPMRTLREIRATGTRARSRSTRRTAVEPYADLLGEMDMLLLMTVEPWFAVQTFLDVVLPKIRRAREMIRGPVAWTSGWRSTAACPPETIERCAEAGADVFVAGRAVYGAEDPAEAVRSLRAQASEAIRAYGG